jgi:hypothetical protein
MVRKAVTPQCMTSSISILVGSVSWTQSIGSARRGRVCVRAFIGVSICAYVWVSLIIPCFVKKRANAKSCSANEGVLVRIFILANMFIWTNYVKTHFQKIVYVHIEILCSYTSLKKHFYVPYKKDKFSCSNMTIHETFFFVFFTQGT